MTLRLPLQAVRCGARPNSPPEGKRAQFLPGCHTIIRPSFGDAKVDTLSMIHELGHNLIDQNTNLGELRQLIHLKVVALALLVGFLLSLPTTLGIRRLASRSLEKMQCYLLTLENLDWESF